MAGVIRAVKPLNRWEHDSIRPGNVGSVGDVLGQVRLKNSAPEMPFRWEMSSAKKNESRVGSNVQNGTSASFTSGGMGPEVIDSGWGGRDEFYTLRGWTHQDISTPDKLVVPVDIPAPSYSWENRMANVYEARTTGQNFLPLPGGFAPEGGVPRGGQVPQTIGIGGTETENVAIHSGSFLDPADQLFQSAEFFRPPRRITPSQPEPSHMESQRGNRMM
jgi:hypothetical protein